MTFFQAIGACFRNATQFSGRASRSEFWWWEVFTLLTKVVPYGVAAAWGGTHPLLASGFVWCAIFLMAVLTLPSLAVASRRCHDSGRSGWWQLVALVPHIGGVWFWLLAAKPGEAGSNRFGPSPVAPGAGGGVRFARFASG